MVRRGGLNARARHPRELCGVAAAAPDMVSNETLAKPKAQRAKESATCAQRAERAIQKHWRKNPMSATENKKMIEDTLGEWVRGDRTAFNNLLADDLRWTVIGNSPVSGRYNSKREFLEGAGARMRDKLATPIKTTPR